MDQVAKDNFYRPILRELIKQHAVMRGEFTLASGKSSSVYLDLRKITLDSMGLKLIVELLKSCLDSRVQAIGGPMTGADPIVGALVFNLGENGFLIRGRVKDHGTQQLIEGRLQPGQRVLLVEDVCTSGKSLLHACEAVEAFGAKVVQTMAVVDRGAGARDLLKEYNYRYLFSLEDLGITLD